ncbi:cytochrome c [Nitratireductor sp. XY-223]|uniref:c-type cytochrome n=1 Tax=Nitratireductor sp. XY-223 TaxID=2561926 RepID=UPI001FEEBBC8|nr:cytochrome c [Nitratireductor sp. XY-223]
MTLLVLALAFAGAGAATLTVWPLGQKDNVDFPDGNASRGAYLARMSGCIACHTNSDQGGAPLAGGLALKTDFGTFYSPNLTTNKQYGIGSWTVGEFATAVRKGISPSGKPYYPAFPYPFYSKLSDQDIADLWAAFQTVPPIDQPSAPQDMSFPYNFRAGLKLWRAIFLDTDPFEPVEGKSEAWNRGKFIVEGPAHCGACHTPRNFAGARQAELELHGADGLPDGGEAPPITSAELARNGWTVNNLKYALRTGILPDGDAFGGAMGEVVRDGTSFLSDEDLTAIATYLLERNQAQ